MVLGLGNPGARYASTRHNLGFRVVDLLRDRSSGAVAAFPDTGPTFHAERCRVGETEVVLAKPRTYMNRSGRAAASLVDGHGFHPQEILVVYDDADLQLGQLRMRREGGHGGHNGMRSILAAVRTRAIPRLRLGVRGETRHDMELADYVLSRFEPDEVEVAQALVDAAAQAVEAVLSGGFEQAQGRFNGTQASPTSKTDAPGPTTDD